MYDLNETSLLFIYGLYEAPNISAPFIEDIYIWKKFTIFYLIIYGFISFLINLNEFDERLIL